MLKMLEKVLSRSFKQVSSPVMWFPFFIIALGKILWMAVLFYSVQWPASIVAGPLIRRFWSAAALHYPGHIFWMDRILSETGVFLDVVLGALATMLIVKLVFSKVSLREQEAPFRKMWSVFFIFLILIAVIQGLSSLLSRIAIFGIGFVFSKAHLTNQALAKGVIIGTNITVSAFLYALASYVFPAIYDTGSFIAGMKRGLKMALDLFWVTFLILVFALSCFLPFILAKSPAASIFLIKSYLPEAVLIVSIVSWLWAAVINTVLNVVIVNMYIEERPRYEKI